MEWGQFANFARADSNGDLLEDTEHRTLPNGRMLPFECTMNREILNCGLEEIELVGNEGIGLDEMLAIAEVSVGQSTVCEVE